MKTKRETQKQKLEFLNNDLERRKKSNVRLSFNRLQEWNQAEQTFVDSLVTLLDYETDVIEANLPYISSKFLCSVKDKPEKINKLNSLIRVLQTTIKTAVSNDMFNAALEIGRIEERLEQKRKPMPIEYSVKEFASLAKCHEHTIRKYFHDGRLKGRQDSKGIFIFASELEEYKK